MSTLPNPAPITRATGAYWAHCARCDDLFPAVPGELHCWRCASDRPARLLPGMPTGPASGAEPHPGRG